MSYAQADRFYTDNSLSLQLRPIVAVSSQQGLALSFVVSLG